MALSTTEVITLGGIVIQTVLYLLAGYAVIIRHDESNKNVKTEMQLMQDQLKKLADVVTALAVQTVRVDNLGQNLTMLQRTVEDLRRGAGWVSTPARSNIDGEYASKS